MQEYRYDVFISYPRAGTIAEWVKDVFTPLLRDHLTDILGRPAKVYLDVKSEEPGSVWPRSIAEAHARSRVVVPVLCAPFFQSGWCLSEFKNAAAREKQLPLAQRRSRVAVVPVRFNDSEPDRLEGLGEALRDAVLARTYRDLARFSPLVKAHVSADSGMQANFDFRVELQGLCAVLHKAIQAAPPYDPTWPRMQEKPISGQDPSWRAIL